MHARDEHTQRGERFTQTLYVVFLRCKRCSHTHEKTFCGHIFQVQEVTGSSLTFCARYTCTKQISRQKQ